MLRIALKASLELMFTEWKNVWKAVVGITLAVGLVSIISAVNFSIQVLLIAYASTFVLLTAIFTGILRWWTTAKTKGDLKEMYFFFFMIPLFAIGIMAESRERQRRGW